jgi:hypothetical protein
MNKEYKELIELAEKMDQRCQKEKDSYNFPSPFEIEPIIDKIQNMMSQLSVEGKDNTPEFEKLFELEYILCDHYVDTYER